MLDQEGGLIVPCAGGHIVVIVGVVGWHRQHWGSGGVHHPHPRHLINGDGHRQHWGSGGGCGWQWWQPLSLSAGGGRVIDGGGGGGGGGCCQRWGSGGWWWWLRRRCWWVAVVVVDAGSGGGGICCPGHVAACHVRSFAHNATMGRGEREREGRGEYVHMYVQWDLENIWSTSITSAIPTCNIVTPLPTTTTTH